MDDNSTPKKAAIEEDNLLKVAASCLEVNVSIHSSG